MTLLSRPDRAPRLNTRVNRCCPRHEVGTPADAIPAKVGFRLIARVVMRLGFMMYLVAGDGLEPPTSRL